MVDLDFLKIIDEKAALLDETSDFIWQQAETAFTEFKSAERLCKVLRDEGFEVTENLANIKTAFKGSFGSGRPVIGFLGEFDALEGLSQKSGETTHQSIGGHAGHGCGHNLLGTALLGAAIAAKRFLEQNKLPGTVVYFGCPGEEGGSGKAFMARDGVFDGLDAALSWHPGEQTGVRANTSLANCQVLYKFDGKPSHAGLTPHLGRSALDAVELMDIGVNYMREHMISDARVHYAVTDSGGKAPNVVQAHAEVLYLIRAPKNEQVRELYERINKIAEGAAMMTETKASHDFIKACSNTVLNSTIEQVLYDKMVQIGTPVPTEQDVAFARKMTVEGLAGNPKADPEHPLHYEIIPYAQTVGHGSTDVGDVSWVCPVGQIKGATEAYGTPGHSWQHTAQNCTPWAKNLTRFVAKALAATAAELYTDPELLQKAQEEHKKLVGPKGYECPIPAGVKPRSMTDI